MLSRIRFSSLALVPAMLLFLCVSSSAQITFEDFSDTSLTTRYLQLNGSASLPGTPPVLRLTKGSDPSNEGSTVYFQDKTHIQGLGKQPVASGFTSWFAFQINSLQCCSPGDGIAFIVQNSTGTDMSMCASGLGVIALGAGGSQTCPDQGGALGYAGINNSLVVEFDVVQDLWDPTSNHIAIQTCGPNINTPVHLPGDFSIGNNNQVQSCLLYQSQQSIDSNIPVMGGTCNGETCMDGSTQNVVLGYTPPSGNQQGSLQIWLDPMFLSGTHIPIGPPTMAVPYNIVYDAENNPSGLQLDPANGGSAWVGFTASQPIAGGENQDILGWEFTLHSPVQITETIQPGGTPTVFAFGAHQSAVTYPQGFQNPSGVQMTVTATPVDRQTFYQMRLAGTQFANEQCIVYAGTGSGNPPTSTNGNCVVYSYTCQDSSGNPVTCPSEPLCTDPQQDQCINVDTSFYTMDNVTATNADYLENDMMGDNNWMSIFLSFQPRKIDSSTSGGTRGFGGGGSQLARKVSKKVLAPQVGSADIVATFNPTKP